MASHFSALGIPFGDEDEYLQGVQRIADAAGAPEELPEGRLLYGWRDDSGAAADVLVSVAEGQLSLECVTPLLTATARQQVTVAGLHPDECPGCTVVKVELNDTDGQMAYPMIVSPARMPAIATELADNLGRPRTARIGLLAEELDVYADAAAFNAAGEEPRFAPESFVPMGMFGDAQPRVLCNGVVAAQQTRRNSLFGNEFGVLRVRSLAADYDIAYDLSEHPGPVAAGMIVSVTGWATASLS